MCPQGVWTHWKPFPNLYLLTRPDPTDPAVSKGKDFETVPSQTYLKV